MGRGFFWLDGLEYGFNDSGYELAIILAKFGKELVLIMITFFFLNKFFFFLFNHISIGVKWLFMLTINK